MTPTEREKIVHRIISGYLKCDIEDELGHPIPLLLTYPNRLQRYMAEEIYLDAFKRAALAGSYTEDEYMEFLYEKGLWDKKSQQHLDGLPKDLEELKLRLFQAVYKSNERNTIRKYIAEAKHKQIELTNRLHQYDYLSAVGVAHMTKSRYIIAASLIRLDGSKLFRENELWTVPDDIVETAAATFATNKLNEATVRELARTDPWRTIWMARKAENSVFGIPAVDLNEEQRMLSIWTSVYDNIYEHPESPSEEIINDDDMLDGWMILQRREREARRQGDSAKNLLSNEKIRDSEEIYIPVDTIEDARKIEEMNDVGASIMKRKRMALVQQKGIVNEQDMPDSQMKIRTEYNRQFIEHTRGR